MQIVQAIFSVSLLVPFVFANHHHDQQQPQLSKPPSPRRVAIIGAGAAGTSAAFHIANFSASAGIPVHISLFERSSYIGGRSTTVNVYNDSTEPVELGASIFIPANRLLFEAADRFNLKLVSAGDRAPEGWTADELGIWDGEKFVLTQGSGGWWDMARLILRYGFWSPMKVQRLVNSMVDRFLGMYEEPIFPFEEIETAAERVGVLGLVATTGRSYLEEQGVSRRFFWEVIQAATRVNYAQNLGVINALDTMVSMAPQGAVAVSGGNWRLFDGFAIHGANRIHLDTPIDRIKKNITSGKYTLGSTEKKSAAADFFSEFDEVVIATPYQFSNLQVKPALSSTPNSVPYVTLHVTLFTSRHLLSPAAFKMVPGARVPLVVLTTLPDDEDPGHKTPYAGNAGFFSISMLRPITNKKTNTDEYLYKIFSPVPVTPNFLAHKLGISKIPNSIAEFDKADVSWIYQKVWKSYPVEFPRVTFEQTRLAPNVWYTGGMDSFISCMETNALMGMNVARLIVDQWTGKKTAESPSPIVAKSLEF